MFLNPLFYRALNAINPISRGRLWSKAKTFCEHWENGVSRATSQRKGPTGKIVLQQGGIRRNAATITVVSFFFVGSAEASE
jgi:hypothetical protein